MEKYININTLVNNEINNTFKDLVLCPLCSNILIDPFMCEKCQKAYCKKCIDEFSQKNNKCPNNCESSGYQKCIGKNDILSKLKFKCGKCEKEFLYDDLMKHVANCTGDKNSDINEINLEEVPTKRVRRVTKEELKKNVKKDAINITCNLNNFYNL